MNFSRTHADQVLERISNDPEGPPVGNLANELLLEFHRGYPLDHLRTLLQNADKRVVSTGAWIASELGEIGKPLLKDVITLLARPERRIRFYTIDCVLVWASPSDVTELSSVIKLIDDPDSVIRLKVMDFLSRASAEQLQSVLLFLEASEPGQIYYQGLKYLLDPHFGASQAGIAALTNDEPLLRKCAVVAAVRVFRQDRAKSGSVRYAACTDDSDIKLFAEHTLSLAL